MSGAAAQTHGDHSQWAETSHCRVAGVRHFGAFAALELIAPRVARRAAPGQFVMVTVPGGGFLLRRPISLFAAHGDRIGLLVEARGGGSERLTQLDVGDARRRRRPARQRVPHGGRHQRAARRRRHRLRAAAVPGGRAGGGGRARHRRLRLPRLPLRPRRRRLQHRPPLGGHRGRQRGEGRHGAPPARRPRRRARHHRVRLRPHAHDRRRPAVDVRTRACAATSPSRPTWPAAPARATAASSTRRAASCACAARDRCSAWTR